MCPALPARPSEGVAVDVVPGRGLASVGQYVGEPVGTLVRTVPCMFRIMLDQRRVTGTRRAPQAVRYRRSWTIVGQAEKRKVGGSTRP